MLISALRESIRDKIKELYKINFSKKAKSRVSIKTIYTLFIRTFIVRQNIADFILLLLRQLLWEKNTNSEN